MMNNSIINKGGNIRLSLNLGVNTPRVFKIVQTTAKAFLLKAETGKTTWIPKSKIAWDTSWECHFIKQSFRRNLCALQTAVLVCD